ncbi:MAG TPA: heavy-metal-associated domain-containing protein [Burkholderiaceae bacterium]|jgi:copper chaperone|nr:heavy-metal-associated domain-containing protein [Burkholderiaceae bacterium]
MFEFHVEDMSCSHCVGAITKAVQAADPGASVEIDLSQHLVRVTGTATREAVAAVIRDAGYTPV